MARSTRYNHLLPFLGDKDDMRGRLIIDAMKDNFNQNELILIIQSITLNIRYFMDGRLTLFA